MSEPGLESELLKVVREIRGLEQHLVMLRSRDSANSRTLQEEIAPRLEERERQLEVLRATVQTQRGEPPEQAHPAVRRAGLSSGIF